MSEKWIQNIPKGCRVLLQSTNFSHPEHVNIKSNREEFKRSLNEIELIAEDTLDCGIYLRYTIFGTKK